MKYRLALFAEEFTGDIEEFDTQKEAEAFASGYGDAGGRYGGGHCSAYNLEEAQDLLDEYIEDAEDEYDKIKIKEMKQAIRLLRKP